jgi:hypothetical protein
LEQVLQLEVHVTHTLFIPIFPAGQGFIQILPSKFKLIQDVQLEAWLAHVAQSAEVLQSVAYPVLL